MIGRLTRDPELRTTPNGKNVATFGIAVTKRFKPQDGGPDADFFNVKAWGQTADFVSNYLAKGRLVSVDGRLDTRKYTDSNGVNREVVEIVAENVQSLDRPREDAPQPLTAGTTPQAAPEEEYDPFA